MVNNLKNRKLAVVLSLILFSSVPFQMACDKNKVRQLAQVEDNVAQGLLATANIVKDAKELGQLSQEDIDVLKPLLNSVAEANGSAIRIAKTLNETENIPLNKQGEILQAISFLSDTLNQLNSEGLLRIKNPAKRAAFSALVLTMQSVASSVVIILNIKGGN